MENKLLGIILIVSISLNLAFMGAWSIHRFGDWRNPSIENHRQSTPSAGMSSFHQELGVTAKQWDQLEPLLLQFRHVTIGQRQEIMKLREQLFKLLGSSPVDEQAIKEKQEQLLAGQRRMQNIVMGHILQEKEILTESQSTELIQKLFNQSHPKRGIRKGPGLERLWGERDFHEGSTNKERVD